MHPAWVDGLQKAAVQIVEPGKGPLPDLVVAPANLRDAGLRSGAPMVLLDGRPRGVGPRQSQTVRRYLPIPTRSGAIVIADLSHGGAAERALDVGTHAGNTRAAAKRELARMLIRSRLLPPIVPMYTVHSSSSTTPALVQEAARQADVEIAGWFLLIEPGPDNTRLVFYLLTGRGNADLVVKFSRLMDDTHKARAEARALADARSVGPAVVAHVPKAFGEFVISRYHATVETAAVGQTLGRTVSGRGPRRQKLSQIEAVVDWLCEIGKTTARRRGFLDDDVREIAARSGSRADAARLLAVAESTPAVFQHGDLNEGNVIVDGDAFAVIDWHLARADGFPLWDLICLAVCTLPLLDRALYERSSRREDEHVQHLGDLFRGRAPSSVVFLRWLRAVADASGVDRHVVPEIVTMCFLWYSSKQWAGWRLFERFTAEWLADPELGMSWPLWRDSISGS